MSSPFRDLFKSYQHAFDALAITPEMGENLCVYLEFLWEANQALNLVSRKMTPEALVTDHLLDSLIGLPHFPKVNSIADLGTGGGFPAVPLALCMPETQFFLYEKSPLKCKYLDALQEIAPNLVVRGALDPDGHFEAVDIVTARGFKPIKDILRFTAEHRERGGRYILYKARRAKIDEELAAAKGFKAEIVRLKPYGEAEERHLVLG